MYDPLDDTHEHEVWERRQKYIIVGSGCCTLVFIIAAIYVYITMTHKDAGHDIHHVLPSKQITP